MKPMKPKQGGVTQHVRIKGHIPFKQLYMRSRSFFKDRNYECTEKKYKDKGNEVEVEWDYSREIDEYWKYKIEVKIHIWDCSPVTVEKEGKQVEMLAGRMEMFINGEINGNYDKSIFDDKTWLNTLYHNLYQKITERDFDENWEADMIFACDEYRNMVKKLCDVQIQY